jgi:hypothetical protein
MSFFPIKFYLDLQATYNEGCAKRVGWAVLYSPAARTSAGNCAIAGRTFIFYIMRNYEQALPE